MSRRGAAGLGLAALALVATLAWWLAREEGGERADRDSGLDEAALAGGAAAAPSLPEAAPGTEAVLLAAGPDAPAESPDATLAARGVLVIELRHEADETPVAGAEIKLFATITDVEPKKQHRASGRTADDGTWRVEFDHAVQVWLVRALPGDGHAFFEMNTDVVEIPLGASERVVLKAARGAVVRGQIVDQAERPLPGATVLAWSEMRWAIENGDDPLPEPHARATCDGAGRFELGGLGPQLVLMPEAPGLAAASGVAGPIHDGEVVDDVTLVLGPALELRGRVVDADGGPVSGVRVRAGHSNATPIQAGLDPARALKVVQTTDVDGRFLLAPLAGPRCGVSVHAKGFQPWSGTVTPGGDELLIQLSRGCALSGLVRGADGALLDGAEVRLAGASEDKFGQDTISVQTVDGRFTFEALVPTDEAILGVSAAGHALLVREGVAVGSDGAAPLELRLEPASPIAGRVVDEHDQPIEGADVSVRGDRSIETTRLDGLSWEDWFWVGKTRSDADGRFRLERLYDGLFELAVEDPRHRGLRHTQRLHSGAEDLLIRLDSAVLRRAVLTGQVYDALSGAPVDDFHVWLEPLDPERRFPGTRVPVERFQGTQGAFRMEGIEPGRWRPTADAEGYARTAGPELELREGEQQVEIGIRPARTLRLRVIDQDGAPVRGIFVSFEDSRGERIDLQAQPVGDGTIGMSDKAGELTAHELPAELVTVVLRVPLVPGAEVGARNLRFPVDLRAQPEGVQELAIERTRARCLVLSLHETNATAGASVFDADDPAATEALRPLIEKDALRSIERPISVTVTDAAGSVVDTAHCAPNPGVDGAWRVTSSVCDSEGEPASWLAAALPAGASTAVIAAEGYETVTLELPAGERHLQRLVLLRPR
jgi:protocatechuate 3,4-dioxygenase beta subunit